MQQNSSKILILSWFRSSQNVSNNCCEKIREVFRHSECLDTSFFFNADCKEYKKTSY